MPDDIEVLKRKVSALRLTVGTLIAWMVQSANSPISSEEARELLRKLDDGSDA
jgi:hypothetical protein